jgi:hypothetical protein
MKDWNDEELHKLLKEAVPPVAESAVTSDLWPHMLRRLDRRDIRVSWMDWVLLGALVVLLWIFPETTATLLYQL